MTGLCYYDLNRYGGFVIDGEKGCRYITTRITTDEVILSRVSELTMPVKLREVSIFQKSDEKGDHHFAGHHFAFEALITTATNCKTKKPCLVVVSIVEGAVEWVYVFSLDKVALIQHRVERIHFEN